MEIPEKLKQIKILLVDDDETLRELNKAILNAGGYENVSTAEDGQAALTRLGNEQFDIVVCDWKMPNMTGLELLEKVRSDEKLKNIAFLMATMVSNAESVTKAVKAGVTDYIAKPFNPDILCKKVVTTYAKNLKRLKEG